MEYRKADQADLSAVLALIQDTIRAIYPRYYPQGCVDYFLNWHSQERVSAAIDAGQVYILLDGGELVGTGSQEGDRITRVFVLPERQGRGYGRYILDRLEEAVAADYDTVQLDASLPAVHLYERRGYHTVEHQSEETESGCVLVWDVMEKRPREDRIMDQNTWFFFNQKPEAIPLYEVFEERLLAELEGVIIQPQKSQITLKNRRVFGAVSFLAARKAKDRPDPYITVTLGLNRREGSPRIDQASEPYPGRWTHHIVIGSPEEIDDELMAWVREAYDFAAAKR